MKVIRAEHAGACYGVNRAVDMALDAVSDGGVAQTLGPLIHNPQVVEKLAASGVSVCETVDDLDADTVIIRSHGVIPQVKKQLEEKALRVIDATCPHVARAQKAAADLARQGYFVIVVGEESHPEVEGLRAYAVDAGAGVVVVSEAGQVPRDLPARVGVVVQTTQMNETLESVIEAIRKQGIEPLVKDTICSATRLRQESAASLASAVDALVVIGGHNSSNTTRLFEICRALCPKVYHVESTDEIDPSWFVGCDKVGVTAGASTPEDQIDDVVAYLQGL